MHYCPKCRLPHHIPTRPSFHLKGVWTYDQNHLAPTFAPDIHLSIGPHWDDDHLSDSFTERTLCHYRLLKGELHYLNTGEIIALPLFPPHLLHRMNSHIKDI